MARKRYSDEDCLSFITPYWPLVTYRRHHDEQNNRQLSSNAHSRPFLNSQTTRKSGRGAWYEPRPAPYNMKSAAVNLINPIALIWNSVALSLSVSPKIIV